MFLIMKIKKNDKVKKIIIPKYQTFFTATLSQSAKRVNKNCYKMVHQLFFFKLST